MIKTLSRHPLLQEALTFVNQTPSGPGRAVLASSPDGDIAGLDTSLMQIFCDTGDKRAFEYLYGLTADALLGWIRVRANQVACRLDVREILQDTFVNIYHYAKTFRGVGENGFRRWARTIAANAMHRASRRRTLVFSDWTDGVLQLPSPGGDPQGMALAREQVVELRRGLTLLLAVVPLAMGTLSPRDRYVLQAVDTQGAPYRDVEQELGLRSGALKMIVHRARIRLRTSLTRMLAGKPLR